MDEVLAVMALLPWVGAAFAWARIKWVERRDEKLRGK
jgi:hypothetical protein